MKILIQIKDRKVKLVLFKGKTEIDFLDINDEYKLSEDLLPEIDKLIRKNKLKKEDIKRIEIESDLEDNFTTPRIARSISNAWNFKLKNRE